MNKATTGNNTNHTAEGICVVTYDSLLSAEQDSFLPSVYSLWMKVRDSISAYWEPVFCSFQPEDTCCKNAPGHHSSTDSATSMTSWLSV